MVVHFLTPTGSETLDPKKYITRPALYVTANSAADVAFGSTSDSAARPHDFRLTLEIGNVAQQQI
jgi:hypothetical protein